MSDEKFMEKSRTWLDDLKIRAGYGTTGNSNIDSYNWAFQYGTGNRYLYSINGSDTEVYQGFGVTNLGDIEAKWETSKMFNVPAAGFRPCCAPLSPAPFSAAGLPRCTGVSAIPGASGFSGAGPGRPNTLS